jgi:hypothetical protein
MKFKALSTFVPDPEKFRTGPPPVPTVFQQPADPLARLLSLGDVDRILCDGALRQRMVSVVRDGQRVPASQYTWADRPTQPGFADVVRAGAISAMLRDGATIVLETLQRTWRPVGDVCRRLSFEVGLPVGANAYLTPANSQGFAHHYDTHAVLIVQTAGSKTWQLHEPVFPDPLEHQPWRPDSVSDADWERLRHGEPALHTVLRPGDVLWIPRGWIHNGFATTEPSLHVTFGFPATTPYWLATQLFQRLDTLRELRQELPWGVAHDPERLRDAVDETIEAMIRGLRGVDRAASVAAAATTMRSYFLEPAREPVTSVLVDEIGPATGVVTVAEAVLGTERLAGGGLLLHLADAAVTLDAPAARALEPLWEDIDSGRPWCAHDLAAALGEVAAVALVVDLIQAGVLRRAATARGAGPVGDAGRNVDELVADGGRPSATTP